MNWFKKKQKQQANEDYKNFKSLQGMYLAGNILIEGKSITPVFNEYVANKVVAAVSAGKKIKIGYIKFMCMKHSNTAVYYALKAGAEKQGIPFKYSINDLFYVIDSTDYVNVLTEIRKQIELSDISKKLSPS